MEGFDEVTQFAIRCRFVGKRTNALAFATVLEQKKGESELKHANFYALPPSNMRFLVEHTNWRAAWARACCESLGGGIHNFWRANPAPLLVVTDANGKSGPPTANLKSCYSPDSTMRARVTLDLDSDPDFKSPDLLDGDAMWQAVCQVLQVHLVIAGGGDWESERCIFFYGTTPVKQRTGHLVFCDVSFANTDGNAFRGKHGKAVKKAVNDALQVALAPFGVRGDMSIATSGLRYEFTDKLEKDKTWRGAVSLPEFSWNVDVEGMEWTDMISIIDPLCIPGDAAFDRAASWEAEVDVNPRPQKQPRQVAAPPPVVVRHPRTDNPTSIVQRVVQRFPALDGQLVCKQVAWQQSADLYVSTGRYCPLREGDHSGTGKVKVIHQTDTDVLLVGCFACESRGIAPLRILPPERELIESESRTVLASMNERHFIAPMGSVGNNKFYVWTVPLRWEDEFRFQLPNEFAVGNSHQSYWYVPQDSKSRKAKKITYARMWLDSEDRRTFPNGGVCAPMGAPDGYFNTWRGFNPKVTAMVDKLYDVPASELADMCPLYLQHLEVNICGGDSPLMAFVLSWIKFLFTRLDEKSGVALVLSGEPGCGKTYFFEVLLEIIGSHHSNVTHDSGAMSAQFAHVKSGDMRLEVFDEATTHNDQRKRGIINGLITSDKLRQERKYREAETVRSFTNLIIVSNYNRAVDAIVGERRFQCIDVAYRVKDMDKTEFFNAAFAEMQDLRSVAAFYVLLTRHCEEEFHPHNIVHNESLWRNVYLGLPPIQKWWYNCLRYGHMRVASVRRIVRVTGIAEEDAAADAAADALDVNLWNQLGIGMDVAFTPLRESVQAFVRGAPPTNAEIESLLSLGNQDPKAFPLHKVGKTKGQEVYVSLSTLAQCRTNFAHYIQFPAEKIFSQWTHELKQK